MVKLIFKRRPNKILRIKRVINPTIKTIMPNKSLNFKPETFEQIRAKHGQVAEHMEPGEFFPEDYSDFEGVGPGIHPPRGSATAESKPARGFVPGMRGGIRY